MIGRLLDSTKTFFDNFNIKPANVKLPKSLVISMVSLACINAFVLAFVYSKRLIKTKEILVPIEEKEIDSQRQRTNEDRKKICETNLLLIDQTYYKTTNTMQLLQSGKRLHNISKTVPYENESVLAITPKTTKMNILIVNKDCLDTAKEYVLKGDRVVVLNFAGPEEPGGGFQDGTNGQEEDLCYRSELAGLMKFHDQEQIAKTGNEELEKDLVYPLFKHLIHTPRVLVFRQSKEQAYALLDDPFKVGILTSAALVEPKLNTIEGVVDYESEVDKKTLECRIIGQLRTAYENNYDTVILGAFGCGAFKNPPQAVAKIYQKVINEHFKDTFKTIVFAILDDQQFRQLHNPMGNFKPFEDCFSQTESKL